MFNKICFRFGPMLIFPFETKFYGRYSCRKTFSYLLPFNKIALNIWQKKKFEFIHFVNFLLKGADSWLRTSDSLSNHGPLSLSVSLSAPTSLLPHCIITSSWTNLNFPSTVPRRFVSVTMRLSSSSTLFGRLSYHSLGSSPGRVSGGLCGAACWPPSTSIFGGTVSGGLCGAVCWPPSTSIFGGTVFGSLSSSDAILNEIIRRNAKKN